VARKREPKRTDLVNSAQVATYLRAGSKLIERALSATTTASALPNARARPYWSGLGFLTQRAVIREVEHIEPPFLRLQGAGPFRSTWKSHKDYLDDLLSFFLHPINYEHQYGVDAATRENWVSGSDSLVDAIDRTAAQEVAVLCQMPLFRLQIMMAATADRNDGIRTAIANNYRGALDPWIKIYEETFAARGLRVREGVTTRQVADMLAAVAEGFALRSLGDPDAGDGETPAGGLVGLAVVAILNSCLVPVGQVGGEPLRVDFDRWTKRLPPRG
jgi:hypothetical protein